MNFSEWLWKRFYEWRGNSLKNVSDFADYLGIRQQSVSDWLNGKYLPKGSKHITRMAAVYPDVYEVLGIPQPPEIGGDYLPLGLRKRIRDAQAEVERRLRDRNLTGSEPEALEIATKVFQDFGFTWSDTIQPGHDG